MDIGLCTISNREAPVETVLSLAAEAGYDGVEVWGKDHVGDGQCRTIRTHAEELDLTIPVYGSYLRPGTIEFTDEYEYELSIAEKLGADRIRVWAGTQEFDGHDVAHWERVVDDLRELTERATTTNVAVTVERHAGTLTNTTAGARRLVAAVDDPACQLNWQPRFSMTPEAIVTDARKLAPVSNHVHLQAVAERGSRRHCGLSEAFFDISAVVESFEDAGFGGFLAVEFVRDDCEYADAIEDDLQYLRSLTG